MFPGTLIKQPAESRLYTMSFASLLLPGETVAGVTSVTASPAGLTLVGSPTFGANLAKQRISGGADKVTYKVTYLVTTSAGNTLEAEGFLKVRDK